MEDTSHGDDPKTNPQLTENFFIRAEYIFHSDSTNKKFDNIIARALANIKAHEPFFSKFKHFGLRFHFLTPKKRDVPCSDKIMLKTKLTHTYTYYKFIQKHYLSNTPARNPQHRFMFIKSKYTYTPLYFLNSTYFIKSTNLYGILRNYDPVRLMYIFCPLTNTFPIDDTRPIIISPTKNLYSQLK